MMTAQRYKFCYFGGINAIFYLVISQGLSKNMKKSIFFLLIYCLSVSYGFSQEVISLEGRRSATDFESNILFFEDEKRAFKAEDIIQGKLDTAFIPPPAKGLNFGLRPSNFWIKFKVKNTNPVLKSHIGTQENLWYLENAYSTIDSLLLYHIPPEGDGSRAIAGGRVSKVKHVYPYISYVFPLQLHDDGVHTFYLKVNSLGPANIALTLSSAYEFEQTAFVTNLFYGLFFGALSIMMFYNLFLFTAIRKIRYLYYCAYIFFYIIAQISNSGHGFTYLWFDSVALEKSILLLTVHIDIVFIVLFSFDFLEISRKLPRLYKYYPFILGYCIFSVLAFFFVPFKLYILMTILWTFISTTLVFSLGVYVWYKGERYARYFVLGWITFLIGLAILNVKNIGLIPDSFILHHIHQLGALIEVLLFSFALADQINQFKEEKEIAQAENERILEEQNKLLEQKVKERTTELEQSQEEILSQNEQLEIQSKELKQAYQDIKSSINYAKSIQNAMLPPLELLENLFEDAFVLFKPKDVVSGDFYWFVEVDNKIIVAAADCTGHGVPGAFMSLISNDLLTEVIINRKIYEADLILNKMHKGIRNILKQKESNNRDGMDIALCVIDKDKKEMQFAGAHNPLVYFQDNQLFYIKGSRLSIGGEQREKERIFEKHVISIEKPTTCYIFSDGFQDQFGSQARKKYGINRLRNLLTEIHQQPMNTQGSILLDTVTNWMGSANEKQIDDMLILGFKIK